MQTGLKVWKKSNDLGIAEDIQFFIKVFRVKRCAAVTFDNLCSASGPCNEQVDISPIVNRS